MLKSGNISVLKSFIKHICMNYVMDYQTIYWISIVSVGYLLFVSV